MEAAFDSVAVHYDEAFTFTKVGEKQRERVWGLLSESGLLKQTVKVLEVNCGTGQDAFRLAEAGHQVLATDISARMIAVCQQKAERAALSAKPEFLQLGFDEINSLSHRGPFDLVFSNFGGLNCTNLTGLFRFLLQAACVLKPGGSLVAVVMPSFCVWETAYYLAKGAFRTAFRRLPGKAQAVIGTQSFPVHYYSPSTFRQIAGPSFQTVRVAPVGFFLPPSYLEHFFQKSPRLLDKLNHLEKAIGHWSALAGGSDHYYIQLRKKG